MKTLCILALALTTICSHASSRQEFNHKVNIQYNKHINNQSGKIIAEHESGLFKIAANQEVVNDHLVYNHLVVTQASGKQTSFEGNFIKYAFSRSGDSLLLVEMLTDGIGYTIFTKENIKNIKQHYDNPESLNLFDHRVNYQISDKGNEFIQSTRIEDEGLTHIKLCVVSPADCNEFFDDIDNTFLDVSLVEDKKLVAFAPNRTIKKINGQIKAVFNASLQLFQNGRLLWKVDLDKKQKWQSAVVNTYKSLVIVASNDRIQIRKLDSGDLLWTFDKTESNYKVVQLFQAYVSKGKLIIPFKNATGELRKDLNALDKL